jgi:hypothetical protein
MKNLKAMYVPVFMIVLFLTALSIGCGASIEDLKIDDSVKVQMAIESGCAAATAAGCFDSSDQCADAITDAVDGQRITPDAVKIILDLLTCEAIHDAISNIDVAADKKKKELKEGILVEGRLIDGIYNIIVGITKPLEASLLEKEKWVERQEEKRKEALRSERAEKIEPYDVDSTLI